MSEEPRYASIKVRMGENGWAFPVVERVPGGWQSGEHHYADADVLDVQPLVVTTQETAARLTLLANQARQFIDAGDAGPAEGWRNGFRVILDGWGG